MCVSFCEFVRVVASVCELSRVSASVGGFS